MPRASAEYYYDHTHTLRKVYTDGAWLTEPTRDFPEIGQVELAFPLIPGKTWSFSLRDPTFAIPIVGDFTVVGCEEVTVPAGTFLAVRIDVVAGAGVPNTTVRWSYWYAPAVKFWVKHTEAPTGLVTRHGGFVLEFFTIDRGKPATP